MHVYHDHVNLIDELLKKFPQVCDVPFGCIMVLELPAFLLILVQLYHNNKKTSTHVKKKKRRLTVKNQVLTRPHQIIK